MATINLATKYSDKIATSCTAESFVIGKTNTEYEFKGAKTVEIPTPVTQDLVDFRRSGTNRYGDPTEMEDTIQAMTVTQDKSASITIDKGNNDEQMMIKNAGKMMHLQIKEKNVPLLDKYAIKQFANNAGTIVGLSSAPTKATIVEMILNAAAAMDDALIPPEDRYLALSSASYNLVRLSPEFVGIEALGKEAISKGVVGQVGGFNLIKVPSNYIPANCYFVAWHKGSVVVPRKLKDAKLHTDAPGISGALMEFREIYDAFVLGARAAGVYAAVASSAVVAEPAISITTHQATITSASTVKYTLDGSDPRYSKSAQIYTAPVTMVAGQTIKAYAYATDKYPSKVAEKKDA